MTVNGCGRQAAAGLKGNDGLMKREAKEAQSQSAMDCRPKLVDFPPGHTLRGKLPRGNPSQPDSLKNGERGSNCLLLQPTVKGVEFVVRIRPTPISTQKIAPKSLNGQVDAARWEQQGLGGRLEDRRTEWLTRRVLEEDHILRETYKLS
ncbi:MAG: hypothetical protein LQ342_006683 [Letrouitia transgressa]|nr:MAG: hypothetical protein LQ342_006683 [Letrouitia transgressa]